LKCEVPGCNEEQTKVLTLEIDSANGFETKEQKHYYCKEHHKIAKKRSVYHGIRIIK